MLATLPIRENTMQSQQSQQFPVLSSPKPATSAWAWVAIGAVALGLICFALYFVASNAFINRWDEAGPQAILPFLGYSGMVLLVAALAFGIIGIVRSRKRTVGIIAVGLVVLVAVAPILLLIFGWFGYFVMGAASQLSGGETLG